MTVASSVVVVSYRPGDWLAPCLESVMDQADQVIVVDNASADSAASEVARSFGAQVLRSPSNVGFPAGFALGLAQCRGELVGLLNDDATADARWLDSAAAVLANPAVAAVTPKIVLKGSYAEVSLGDAAWFAPGDDRPLGRRLGSVTVDGVERIDRAVGAGVHRLEHSSADGSKPAEKWRWTTGPSPFYVPIAGSSPEPHVEIDGEPTAVSAVTRIVNNAGLFLLDHGIGGDHGFGAPDDGRFDGSREPFGFSGTAPVFRRETLGALGSLESRFFAYNEDTDWCLRACLAGMTVAYDPTTAVEHRLSATSGGTEDPAVRFLARRNSLLCLVRNAPPEVAQRYVWRHLVDGPADGVRRSFLSNLPWALGSRASLRRRWVTSPREVWDRWAGAGITWENGPVGAAAPPPGGSLGAA